MPFHTREREDNPMLLNENEKFIISCMTSAKLRNDRAKTMIRHSFYTKDDPRKKLIEERNQFLNDALEQLHRDYGIAYTPIRPYAEKIDEQYHILVASLQNIRKSVLARTA